jgi:hypothetical protein
MVLGEAEHHDSQIMWQKLLTSWWTGSRERRGLKIRYSLQRHSSMAYFLQPSSISESFHHLPK